MDRLVGKQAELSPWAYVYRADLKEQQKPEAYFVIRRLQRLDQAYRPVSILLTQGEAKKGEPWPAQSGDWQLFSRQSVWDHGELLPAPNGSLQSALLWEGHVHVTRLELHWPKSGPKAPLPPSVEVRVYPTPYGWFGWQSDQRLRTVPEISDDGLTWIYRGDWDGVDMVAAFIEPHDGAPTPVPQVLAYGPETWKRVDLKIEWGFADGAQSKPFDGRIEGFFGLVGAIAPLAGDVGTTVTAPGEWKSHKGEEGRKGITVSALYIQPPDELVNGLPRYPYGGPRDTKFTLWTQSGNLTFLVRDLDKGPILAPECGIYVSKAGDGQTAREFATQLATARTKSVRQMTLEHREASWEEAMRQIQLAMLPAGTSLPDYEQVPDPPMQVSVPDKRWTDAWRMGASQLKNGELTYMNLALEAPRPIHAMDAVGLHDDAGKWLQGFLDRPGTLADGDFNDGTGNFCTGKLFHDTATIDCPGGDTYELVHNGGSGRILFDLADHYFLTGDKKWFKKNQWRMQAAAEWIIRQRAKYLDGVPHREDLLVAGLQPPQHIADCAWGASEWKWYGIIDAWYFQGLHRFGQAMAEEDPDNAARYLDAAEQYRKALEKAVHKAIALAPVMKVRNGTYRSYIPPIFYIRGPSIGQVVQIAMTDEDWPLGMADAANVPEANDPRLDGFLDVIEDELALNPTYLFGGNRFQYLSDKRKAAGLPGEDDWFWGGESSQLGYSFLANVYLKRDEIPSFLRQWINNYAAYAMPSPHYYYLEQFMNHENATQMEAWRKGEFRNLLNGHALSYFMEQFRSLLVWEDGDALWLAKATPRAWLEQGKRISVKNAPSYFGPVAYEISSDVDHGKISAVVAMPSRKAPKSVCLRFRHPQATPMKTVTVNGKDWTDFDPAKELVRLHGLKGKVRVEAKY